MAKELFLFFKIIIKNKKTNKLIKNLKILLDIMMANVLFSFES